MDEQTRTRRLYGRVTVATVSAIAEPRVQHAGRDLDGLGEQKLEVSDAFFAVGDPVSCFPTL